MTDPQENRLTMYYAVIRIVDKYNAVWSPNVPFSTSYALFKTKVTGLETQRNLQMAETVGSAKDKAVKRQTLITKAYFITARMQSYAATISNVELAGNVNVPKSEFEKQRDTDLVGLCNNMLARANANAAALVPYGVTAALLTDLQAAITAYSNVISTPRAAIVGVKFATEALKTLFDEASAILTTRMDKDMVLYEFSNVEFYTNYFDARKIINTSTSKRAVSGVITEGDTDIPVVGVSISILSAPGSASRVDGGLKSKPVKKKTSAKGGFYQTNLAPGTYTVKLEKLGFVSKTVTINVVEGETVKIEEVLERE